MPREFELEAREQDQFEREYADWCSRYDVNYIIEREEDLKDNNENQ